MKKYINLKEISLLWKTPGKELWGFTDRLYMTSFFEILRTVVVCQSGTLVCENRGCMWDW
jgi:hypothetical protein